MAESTLTTIFGYDECNLRESIKMFRDNRLLGLFERMPGLLEPLVFAGEEVSIQNGVEGTRPQGWPDRCHGGTCQRL